jgi:prepilin-type N-terminal cleavage/methylation domain-containing protein
MWTKVSDVRREAARRPAFSLTELMAVLTILGVLAALIVPRVVGHQEAAKSAACEANRAEIELQAKLWRRSNGTYPTADLSNISAEPANFPGGLPVCPVDGTAYTIDPTSGTVIGHAH